MTAPTPYEPPDGHIICLLRDVPEGWEHRFGPEDIWEPGRERRPYAAPVLVEARPVRQPDPEGTDISLDGQFIGFVTSVGEMRGRTDLNQWEWACTDQGTWFQLYDNALLFLLFAECTDDFPVVVRRRVS